MTSTTADDSQQGQRIGTAATHWIETVVFGSPLAQAVGVELVSAEWDSIRLRLPFSDHLVTVPGVLHGGVVAAAIDIAGSAASATGVHDDEGATGGATSHLSTAYLQPASGSLDVVAKVVHRTRSTTQSEVTVRTDDGSLVATGQVTSRIFH